MMRGTDIAITGASTTNNIFAKRRRSKKSDRHSTRSERAFLPKNAAPRSPIAVPSGPNVFFA